MHQTYITITLFSQIKEPKNRISDDFLTLRETFLSTAFEPKSNVTIHRIAKLGLIHTHTRQESDYLG